MQKQRTPGEQGAHHGLEGAGAGDAADVAAAFKKRKDGIDLEGDARGEDDGDPGAAPGGLRAAGAGEEEAPADGEQDGDHEQGGDAVPEHCLLQDAGEPCATTGVAGDGAVFGEGKVRGFVRGELQNDH